MAQRKQAKRNNTPKARQPIPTVRFPDGTEAPLGQCLSILEQRLRNVEANIQAIINKLNAVPEDDGPKILLPGHYRGH